MRRLLPTLLMTAVLCFGVAWHANLPAQNAPAKIAPPMPAVLPPALLLPGVKALGVSSCASMACHHANGPIGTRASEYSTWVAVDPHARAYRTLLNADSRRIQAILNASTPERKKLAAHENQQCLNCHGMGPGVPAGSPLHADGVGCEMCHGPAEKWNNTHFLRNTFERTTPGFVDLRNLETRATSCVACHIGDATREVDHDLIAAGHPRLRFEYSAYDAIYPRHWPAKQDQQRHGNSYAARAWLVGQIVDARAALELLSVRASRPEAPWPEFAEYSCTACHQGLRKNQRPSAGRLVWGSWYYPLLGVAETALGTKEPHLTLGVLDRTMRESLPPRYAVGKLAREEASQLVKFLERSTRLKEVPLGAREIETLMEQLACQNGLVEAGWDGATQLYLGLAALNQGLGDVGVKSRLAPSLIDMRQALSAAYPKGARPKYASPTEYDPVRVSGCLETIRKALK